MVDYTRLMGEDEARTLAALNALREDVFQPKVAGANGKIIKRMGDGWIVEFKNVFDAVACAIEIQEHLSGHDFIQLRIGVHIGDVTIQEDDIYGDGINVAARLEALAEPGQVLISDTVHHSLDNKAIKRFGGGEAKQLKNVKRPVGVWRWPASSNSGSQNGSTTNGDHLPLPDKPSIAVLAFDNMSDDPEQAYFSDGITEDIITALSKFHWFFVIARNSSFTYKGKAIDIKRVGWELGVRYVLEGSVRKAGDRIRVTAQLIEAESGNHIWAERFDRDLDDIFELQDEIALTIAAAIEPELAASEQQRALRKPTSDLKAWELIRRGAEKIHQNSRESLLAAGELFKQAVSLDPSYCQAHAYLAFSTHRLVFLGWVTDREAAIRLGIDHAGTAISIDHGDYLAHASLGWLLLLQGNHAAAILELEMSAGINPSYLGVNIALAAAMGGSGDYEKMLEYADQAIRLSPHDPSMWAFLGYKAAAFRGLGQFDKAITTFETASRSPAAQHYVFLGLAASYVDAGRLEEAAAPLQRAREIEPRLSVAYYKENLAGPSNKNNLDQYIESLRKAGLPEE